MRMRSLWKCLVVAPLVFVTACATAGGGQYGAGAVNWARQLNADREPGSWMSAGRTYDEQRYSPLTNINTQNVSQLSLAWYGDIDTERGQESTPVVVDGVLYLTTAWSHVKAYDARNGRKLWEYNPQIDPSFGQISCCDVVNRGVAVWNGKVYLGALDGRLIALDSLTGEVVWEKLTVDHAMPYTITGVPRIIKNKVVIGNGGAEYNARGYVTAYDTETGEQIWRFYTVPGNPALGFEQPELEWAAETWNGEWWRLGGGGTVWDGMAYDEKSDLLYLGVGNGTPWNAALRSPGGGDNLFLASIVAVDPDTGRYVWHYQSTNGETWDHTATQPIMVADLTIEGRKRRVVMQAPKNGFFYVLDARTGELISAEKFAPVDWAERIDMTTGRPVERPAARFDRTGEPAIVSPGPLGAHNWHPMSFSPRTGLVYLPVQENNSGYATVEEFVIRERGYNTGISSVAAASLYNQPGAPPRGAVRSYLQAWDPVNQREVWRVDNAVYGLSGTLATAGDLVFSGAHAGEFSAFDARTGARLWSVQTQARIVAAASTYTIDGEQYVAVLVGARGLPAGQTRTSRLSANNSRIQVYKLGGTATLPTTLVDSTSTIAGALNPPPLTDSNEDVFDGANVYASFCAGCHGADAIADKSIPDVRYTNLLHSLSGWNQVVLDGSRAENGMPGFRGDISEAESRAVLAYVISRANQDKAIEEAAARAAQ